MLDKISAMYEEMARHGQPIRYAHNQGLPMPPQLGQFPYNDSLAEWAGLDKVPQWRRDLVEHLQQSIFGRPETFRDSWTEQEKAAFDVAESACSDMWAKHLVACKKGCADVLANSKVAATAS